MFRYGLFSLLAHRGGKIFVFDLEPLWQPLFQGAVLMAAVSLGALRLLRNRNRLDLYG